MTTEEKERRVPSFLRRASRSGLPRQSSLRWSFNWAFEGIVYVLRTQRNMQIHVAVAVIAGSPRCGGRRSAAGETRTAWGA